MPAPVLQEIVPLLREVESVSLRHAKLVSTLDKTTKRGEIEAVIAVHQSHARRIPAVTPPGAVTFFAKLAGRLIVNQAGGILENAGISLHPHFGDPYIPGSAVKGIARHAAWCEWNEEEDPSKKESLARDIAAVFGFPTADKALDAFLSNLDFKHATGGKIAFLSAVPYDKPVLTLDITNCHHMKYYGSNKPDAVALDNEDPNPQFFPAVESGTVFRFTLSLCGRDNLALIDRAKAWLISGITLHGVGAKTAAGYGWFEYDEAFSQGIAAAVAAETERKRRENEFTKDRSALPVLDALSTDALKPAIAVVEAFLKKWNGREGLQPLRDNLAHNRNRLPQQTPLDRLRERWASAPNAKAIINGDIKNFAKKTDEEKKAIVEILREPGNSIWQQIRSGQKGDVAAAVEAIRSYCKNTLKLGKMP